MSSIIGTWVYNGTSSIFLRYGINISGSLNFTCDGVTYREIRSTYSASNQLDWNISYYASISNNITVYNNSLGTWSDEKYKTIVVTSDEADSGSKLWLVLNFKRVGEDTEYLINHSTLLKLGEVYRYLSGTTDEVIIKDLPNKLVVTAPILDYPEISPNVDSDGRSKIVSPQSPYTAFGYVTVKGIKINNKTITTNGTYTYDNSSGYAESVTVNVSSSGLDTDAINGTKSTITEEDLAGLLKITKYMYQGNTTITKVSLPSSVTSILDYSFFQCSKLASFDAKNSSVTSIGSYAFGSCNKLTLAVFPSTLSTISANALRSSANNNFVFLRTTPPTLANTNAFVTKNGLTITVPTSAVDTYKAATNWSAYASYITGGAENYSA